MNYLLYWSAAAAAGRPSVQRLGRKQTGGKTSTYTRASRPHRHTHRLSTFIPAVCKSFRKPQLVPSQAHPSSALACVFVLLCCGLLWFTFVDARRPPEGLIIFQLGCVHAFSPLFPWNLFDAPKLVPCNLKIGLLNAVVLHTWAHIYYPWPWFTRRTLSLRLV